ncbi:hypothetical protein EB796_016842 [Bugula neritina]|uniref:TIR domain-containing protein n=1 Tax=Bugula neritina TaxID=10212 RepID=A0A7J7JFE5_BUGNE|nr:hypothetical protein EB796_016842 [Bugula neritina]
MSGRRRQGGARHNPHQRSKHGHTSSKHKGVKPTGTRSGGTRSGRRMDHYHMRRRYLHAGLAGAALNGDGLMYDLDDDLLEEDPFAADDVMLDDVNIAEIMGGSDSEDNESVAGNDYEGNVTDGPPPLKSEDHSHVFIYHSANAEDQDQVEHYVSLLENSPHDLKVITNERDFKSDLTHTQNLMLAIALAQRTVLLCSQEFVENDLQQFETIVYSALPEEERKNKLVLLVLPDVELPPSLLKLSRIFYATDHGCYERLTKLLSSAVPSREEETKTPVSPSNGQQSRTVSPSAKTDVTNQNSSTDPQIGAVKETVDYPNGAVIKRVTACKYSKYETPSEEDKEYKNTYCPHSSILCPKQEPQYHVPVSLTRRGLQVTDSEFEDILMSLSEASRVTFFQKAVECSLPCLLLTTMVVTVAITFSLWFLVVGALKHHKAEDGNISGSIFWSFMILVFFIPAVTALVMVAILMHLVNYKYLKYRIKIEELNKRFRETNLVLHCRRAYWACSGKIQLYFIYYNFELCQQTLYCHVHDDMSRINGTATSKSSLFGNGESTTLKLDKIMKRVNTLTKKFEWEYFEALTKDKLPPVEEKDHRKKGMCFCQYVLHREMDNSPTSVVEAVKGRFSSMKKNAFRKSHRRKSQGYGSRVYLAPYSNRNGFANFV